MKSLFTILLLLVVLVVNAQVPPTNWKTGTDIPQNDTWDGSSGSALDTLGWNYIAYYNAHSIHHFASSVGNSNEIIWNLNTGEAAYTRIFIPPGVISVSISVNDESLAGSGTIYFADMGENVVSAGAGTGITGSETWQSNTGAGSYVHQRDSINFFNSESCVLIAWYSDGSTTGPFSPSSMSLNYLVSDTAMYIDWVNGTTTDISLNIFEKGAIKIYPNPAHNQLNIDNLLLNIVNVQILDITGNIIISVSSNKAIQSIDISSLNNGIYFVKTETEVHKFIKK